MSYQCIKRSETCRCSLLTQSLTQRHVWSCWTWRIEGWMDCFTVVSFAKKVNIFHLQSKMLFWMWNFLFLHKRGNTWKTCTMMLQQFVDTPGKSKTSPHCVRNEKQEVFCSNMVWTMKLNFHWSLNSDFAVNYLTLGEKVFSLEISMYS